MTVHNSVKPIRDRIAQLKEEIVTVEKELVKGVEDYFGLVAGVTILIDEREGEVLFRSVCQPINTFGLPYLKGSKRKKDQTFSKAEVLLFYWKVKP